MANIRENTHILLHLPSPVEFYLSDLKKISSNNKEKSKVCDHSSEHHTIKCKHNSEFQQRHIAFLKVITHICLFSWHLFKG